MIEITMTYTDFNGVERTETFRFNLTKQEAIEMQFGKAGGYAEWVEEVVNAKDNGELQKLFKDFLLCAYGKKSEDGRVFMKNDEIREEFAHTQAFSDLYIELAQDDKVAAEFINGVLPKPDKPVAAPTHPALVNN